MTRWAPVAFLTLLLAGCAAAPFRVMPMQDTPIPSPDAVAIAHFGEAERQAAPRGAFNRPLSDGIDLVALARILTGNLPPPPPAASPGSPAVVVPDSAESLLDLTDDALRLRPDDPALLLSRAHLLEVLGRHHAAAAARARAANLARPPSTPPPVIQP